MRTVCRITQACSNGLNIGRAISVGLGAGGPWTSIRLRTQVCRCRTFVRGGKAHPLHGTRARNRSILCAAARRLVFVNMPRTAALADDPFDKAA
jgi:hypothetical protein